MKKNTTPKLGIDLTEISRFQSILKKGEKHLLKKLFTEKEIEYCLSYKESASHFAGIFAAKEAVSKALGTDTFPFVEVEIRHAKNGAPEVWHQGKKVRVSVSITHAGGFAAAVAMR